MGWYGSDAPSYLWNVWEWVSDWHGPSPEGALTDPIGLATGSQRVLRGRSWFSNPRDARVSYRYQNVPSVRLDNIGVRCALDYL